MNKVSAGWELSELQNAFAEGSRGSSGSLLQKRFAILTGGNCQNKMIRNVQKVGGGAEWRIVSFGPGGSESENDDINE